MSREFLARLDRLESNLVEAVTLLGELRQSVVLDAEPPPVTVPAVPSPGLSPLTRLVAPDGGPLSHAYSTIDPWNSDHTGLLLFHGGGRVGLHYPDGKFYQILDGIRHDSRCVWSRKDPNVFYFREGNALLTFNVSNNKRLLQHKFLECQSIDIGGGEGDISEDGEYLPMIGDGNKAFLYSLKTDAIVGKPAFLPSINACYASAGGRLIVTGGFGVELVDPRTGLTAQVAYKQEHMDCGVENGEPIVVWLDDRNNAVTKIRLRDMQETPLLVLDWAIALHVCLPTGKPYAVVSCFAPGGEDVLYADAILKVPLDGSAVRILAHHKSDTTTGSRDERYSGQPKAVASGNQFLFDARENGQNCVYVGSL